MRAAPNWVDVDLSEADNPDKLHIPPSMVPEGMSFQWVTESVLGQPFAQHRAGFEKKGWTPVHQDDFDGQLDGMFMPKGAEGEIKMTGMVLMARPSEMTERAKRADKRAAMEQVQIKEQAWRHGDIGTTLDSRDQSAVGFNHIRKSVEKLVAPDE
jgi:hypothetical protein